jgi:Arc/MetJ family transcription regulator
MDTRTNIVLDDDLVHLAMERARVKTKKAAIEAALRAFVRKPDYAGLLAMRGQGMIAKDYDPDESMARQGFPNWELQDPARGGRAP